MSLKIESKGFTQRYEEYKHTLSRKEAIALKATLDPESELYHEIQRALVLQIGIAKLGNGLNIYTTPESHKLRGGGQKEEELFGQLIHKAIMLKDPDKNLREFIAVYSKMITKEEWLGNLFNEINGKINELSTAAEETISKLQSKDKQLEEKLVFNEKENARLNKEAADKRSEKDQVNVRLAHLGEKIPAIESESRQAVQECENLRGRIREEEEKRRNAAMDFIPVVGFFGGLVTGDYKRMIPGHSVANGIISAIQRDLENAERRLGTKQGELDSLRKEMDSAKAEQDQKTRELESLNSSISNLEADRRALDEDTKKTGRALTAVRNAAFGLKGLQSRFVFLNRTSDELKLLSEVDMLDGKEVDLFLQELGTVRASFLSIDVRMVTITYEKFSFMTFRFDHLTRLECEVTIKDPSEVPPSKELEAALFSGLRFGKDLWLKYFGDIGEEPPLPPDIETILGSPCPFWPGKTVRETHTLFLMPRTVGGQPFNLNTLGALNPKEGDKKQCIVYRKADEGTVGDLISSLGSNSLDKSYWVLMANDILPQSFNKNLADQLQLVTAPYQVSKILEMATCFFLNHVVKGKVSLSGKAFAQEDIAGFWRAYVSLTPDSHIEVTSGGPAMFTSDPHFGISISRRFG